MKNACFVGFFAVAVAMTGCMAEVMDEPLAEESEALRLSPASCDDATADATLSFSYSVDPPIRSSVDSPSTYGSSRCPGWYVVDFQFNSQYWSDGGLYSTSALPSGALTQAQCNDTWLAVELHEANTFLLPYPDPDCTGLFCQLLPGRPAWTLKSSSWIKGQWNNLTGCSLRVNFNERTVKRFGSRMVIKAYSGANPNVTRAVTVTGSVYGL